MTNFIMLVGLPGSGKSTVAQELARQCEANWISSDAIRAELFGSESCQNRPYEVFALMEQRTIESLSHGVNVVYDATNLCRAFRRELLQKIPNCTKKCLIINTPLEECIARQQARTRQVPESVINRMHDLFEVPMFFEGWDTIETYQKSDINLIHELKKDYTLYKQCLHTRDYIANIADEDDDDIVNRDAALCLNILGGAYTYITSNYFDSIAATHNNHGMKKALTIVYLIETFHRTKLNDEYSDRRAILRAAYEWSRSKVCQKN